MAVMTELPSGTVTLLFTDIEGSTRLVRQLGERYREALLEHRRLLREAFRRYGGVEVDTQGDAFFYAFSRATDAVAAARDGQAALSGGELRVRMGLHTGEPVVTDEGYVGLDVHFAARICSAAHGGQVLVSVATARLVEADLRDLGDHWLKDLAAPLRLYQLGQAEFPPLRTRRFSNLPVQSTALIGRDGARVEAGRLLREHRLVTLVGPGGIGKTRLALQVAAEAVDEFEDGVFWVPLTTVRDPELVQPAVARALGVKDGLADHLANREVLLLLDNFEQVVDAAPGLAELLSATARLKLLVTSREALNLTGEWEYAVPSLLPIEALALFTERAKALKAGFEPDDAVAEICRHLDGLPLAIELAAARVKVLAPTQLLERLSGRLDLLTDGARDLPARQRTMRATVEWSCDLLVPDEQDLFARLGVFSGGWTLDAAEAVCQANLDGIQSLVAKSLVGHVQGRFTMLETIRECAVERLHTSSVRDGLWNRHARFFLALAEEAAPALERGDQEAFGRLDIEHDNVRAALDHFIHSGESELEVRLVAAIWHFWFDQGLWHEASRAVERALASSSGTTPARVAVMHGVAWTASRQGDARAGYALAEESLRLSRELGDDRLIAWSQRIMGVCVMDEDRERASELFEKSAGFSESAGDMLGLSASLNNLAITATATGDHRRAVDGLRRALAIARQSRDPRGSSIFLMNLATAERRLGEYRQASAHLAESLAMARLIGLREVIVEVLYGAADLAARVGDYASAGRLVGAGQREGDFGHILEQDDRDEFEHTLSSIRQNLGEDGLYQSIAAGNAMTLDSALEYLQAGSGP